MIDWQDIFEEVKLAPPASEADIRALAMSLAEPPTPTEVATIIARQSNPFAVNDPLYSAYQPPSVDTQNRPLIDTSKPAIN